MRFRRPLRAIPLRQAGAAAVVIISASMLGACALLPFGDSGYDVAAGGTTPTGGGYDMLGNPYVVGGRTYVPQEDPTYSRVGLASWYGADFQGHLTANGEVYDMNRLTAAHTTLPLPSYVRVTNLENGASIVVRVNDRGPFHSDRIIDLSARAAELLGMVQAGVAQVQVDYIGRASLDGNDDRMLMATYQPPNSDRTVNVAYDSATRTLSARNGIGLFDRFANQAAAAVYQPAALTTNDDPLAGLLGAQAYAALPTLTPAERAAEMVADGTLAGASEPVVVQIGVFDEKANADRIAIALTEFGAVTVTEIDNMDGIRWSVRVSTDAAHRQAVIAAASIHGAAGAYALNN
jgi:rare lipoprotein A